MNSFYNIHINPKMITMMNYLNDEFSDRMTNQNNQWVKVIKLFYSIIIFQSRNQQDQETQEVTMSVCMLYLLMNSNEFVDELFMNSSEFIVEFQ